jgi:hypothetical protein
LAIGTRASLACPTKSAWSPYTASMKHVSERFSHGTRNALFLLIVFFAMLATWTFLVFAFNGQGEEGICISLWYARTTEPTGSVITVGVLTCAELQGERSIR